jgi:hypothetical protein
MASDKKGGFSLMIGLGGKKPKADEGGDERESAGKALAAAVKGGDGAEIADAFQLLFDVCSEKSAPVEETEDDELED